MAVFFDNEKAYDKVGREGPLKKMQFLNIDLPGTSMVLSIYLERIAYIRDFLNGRQTWVDINGARTIQARPMTTSKDLNLANTLLDVYTVNEIDVYLDL